MYAKLAGLQYKISYKKGTENGAADALSRRPHMELTAISVSQCTPAWLQQVEASYLGDAQAKELLTKLAVTPHYKEHFTLNSGIIRYKGKIWIGSNKELQKRIIAAMHDTAVGGHSGIPVTLRKLKQLFFWQGMKAAVHAYVKSCTICQRAKPDRNRYPGLLQPLPIPNHAWQIVTMDFIEGLPTSRSANCILVVVDKFSKFAHFLPIKHPFSTSRIASVFLDNIYKLHGLPQAIISDRDRVFTSNFWQKLFELTGTELKMSSAYHPQTDGQTERVNQCVETFLRCFVHSCPSKWK